MSLDDADSEFSLNQPAPKITKSGKQSRPKPKVSHKWGNDEIHKFISIVQDHECIWNFSLKEHKNLNQRESAWQIIDDEMGGLGIAELKAKWTSVSTTYRSVKAKMSAQKSGQGAKTPVHWEFWSDMQFMNKNESANNTVSESNLDFATFAASEMGSILEDENASNSSIIPSSASTTVSMPTSLAAAGSGVAQRKRKASTPSPSPLPFANKEQLIKRAIAVLEKKDEDDEWQKFGDYMASELRKMAITHSETANQTKRKLARGLLDAWEVAESSVSTLTLSNAGMYYGDNPFPSMILFDAAGRQLNDINVTDPVNVAVETVNEAAETVNAAVEASERNRKNSYRFGCANR